LRWEPGSIILPRKRAALMAMSRSLFCALIPAVALPLVACGPTTWGEDAAMRAYVEHHLDAWRGVRSERIIERFGAPDSETALGDGERVLVYRRRQPVLRVLDCEVDFRVGSTGRVAAAQCSGNAEQCRMLLNPATRYSPSRPAPVVIR
jgi:hypothetical protein